jgi:hypothetical protein
MTLFQAQKIIWWGTIYLQHVWSHRFPRMEKGNVHLYLFDHLPISLGCRVPVAQKLYVMPVASDGQRRCANTRRQPRRAIPSNFRSTTPYLLSLILSLWCGTILDEAYDGCRVYIPPFLLPLPSPISRVAAPTRLIWKTWILNSKRRGKDTG